MAGIFMSNDGTMGQLIGAALTGSDPYAGNLAQGWAQTENARIAQERLKMDMDVKRREIEQAQREQEAFRQRAGMETAGAIGQFNRSMMPLAPTVAPLTSFMPQGGDPGSVQPLATQTVPGGQQRPTGLGSVEARAPTPLTPELERELAQTIDVYTRSAKSGDELLKLTAQAKRAFAMKHGLPLGADAQMDIHTGIFGTSGYTPGNQPTEPLRRQFYDEKSAAELRGKPFEWKPGASYSNPPVVQQTLGVPGQMTVPTAAPDAKAHIDLAKEVRNGDAFKRLGNISGSIMSAESLLAKARQTGAWLPTNDQELVTAVAKIADPNTGVKEGEVDRWGGQGYLGNIMAKVRYAFGGGKLDDKTRQELAQFIARARENYGTLAEREMGDWKRLAAANGYDWKRIEASMPLGEAPAAAAAPAAGGAAAPAADPSRPVFTIPGGGGGGPAQSSATAAAPVNLPPAPASGPGSEAQPITGIGGPRDAIQKVPPGAWFVDGPTGRLLRMKGTP